jgi:hypothetical protein
MAALAFFVWTYRGMVKGELFKGWNAKLQVLTLFASAAAVAGLVLYVILPALHFRNIF